MSAPTSLSAVASRRGRSRRRSRLRTGAALVLVLTALVGAGWVVLGSGVLGVSDVTVTGVRRLDAQQVVGKAAIAPGTPLARLDTDALAQRVATLVVVREVEVRRRWPRGVEISVRERRPAAVQARGSSWALVDRSGVVFATVAERPKRLPAVSAPVDAGAAALRSALDVLDALPAPVRAQVRQVRAANAEQVTLRLTGRRTVVWGSPARAGRKAAVLAVLLSRKASVYDVTAPDIPTTRR